MKRKAAKKLGIVARLKSTPKPGRPKWFEKHLTKAGLKELNEIRDAWLAGEFGKWTVSDLYREFIAKYGQVTDLRNFHQFITGK